MAPLDDSNPKIKRRNEARVRNEKAQAELEAAAAELKAAEEDIEPADLPEQDVEQPAVEGETSDEPAPKEEDEHPGAPLEEQEDTVSETNETSDVTAGAAEGTAITDGQTTNGADRETLGKASDDDATTAAETGNAKDGAGVKPTIEPSEVETADVPDSGKPVSEGHMPTEEEAKEIVDNDASDVKPILNQTGDAADPTLGQDKNPTEVQADGKTPAEGSKA